MTAARGPPRGGQATLAFPDPNVFADDSALTAYRGTEATTLERTSVRA